MWRGNVHKTNRTNYVVMMIFTFPTRQLPISSHVRGCDETFFSTRNFPCGKSQKNLARCCPSKKTVMTSWTSILQEQKPAKKTNINRPKKKKNVVAHGLRRAMPWLIRIYVCTEEAGVTLVEHVGFWHVHGQGG